MLVDLANLNIIYLQIFMFKGDMKGLKTAIVLISDRVNSGLLVCDYYDSYWTGVT